MAPQVWAKNGATLVGNKLVWTTEEPALRVGSAVNANFLSKINCARSAPVMMSTTRVIDEQAHQRSIAA